MLKKLTLYHMKTHEQIRPKPQPKTDTHTQTNVFLEYKMLKIATHKLDCDLCF